MAQDPPRSVESKLETRLSLLEELFSKFARNEATQNVIGNGFSNVSDHLGSMARYLQGINEQMAPLRQLVGPRATLNRDQKARLKSLIKAGRPIPWNDLAAVTVEEAAVRYIGQSVPEQPLMALESDVDDRSETS